MHLGKGEQTSLDDLEILRRVHWEISVTGHIFSAKQHLDAVVFYP